VLRLGPDEDVGEDLVARDDADERLPHDLRVLEDVPQELEIAPALQHALSVQSPGARPSARLVAEHLSPGRRCAEAFGQALLGVMEKSGVRIREGASVSRPGS